MSAGVEAAGSTAFVLVAGGLGERLGYSGLKVALPVDSARGASFLQVSPHQEPLTCLECEPLILSLNPSAPESTMEHSLRMAGKIRKHCSSLQGSCAAVPDTAPHTLPLDHLLEPVYGWISIK